MGLTESKQALIGMSLEEATTYIISHTIVENEYKVMQLRCLCINNQLIADTSYYDPHTLHVALNNNVITHFV
jgi:hypothetical protein